MQLLAFTEDEDSKWNQFSLVQSRYFYYLKNLLGLDI